MCVVIVFVLSRRVGVWWRSCFGLVRSEKEPAARIILDDPMNDLTNYVTCTIVATWIHPLCVQLNAELWRIVLLNTEKITYSQHKHLAHEAFSVKHGRKFDFRFVYIYVYLDFGSGTGDGFTFQDPWRIPLTVCDWLFDPTSLWPEPPTISLHSMHRLVSMAWPQFPIK